MTLTKIFLTSLLIIPTLCQEILATSYSVDFNGRSGGFKLKSNMDDIFYNVKYGWLTETQENKYKLDFREFESGSIDNKTFVNTKIYDNDLYVEIRNEMYNTKQSFINEKNQTIHVDEDTMKISLLINGWKFTNMKNTLTLDFIVSNNIGDSVVNLDENTIKMNKFKFIFEPTAIVDNNEKAVTFFTRGNKYYLVFPSFKKDLYYDPSIIFSAKDINYDNMSIELGISMLAVFIAICICWCDI